MDCFTKRQLCLIYGDDSAEVIASNNNDNAAQKEGLEEYEEEDHKEVGDAMDHTAPEASEIPRGHDNVR